MLKEITSSFTLTLALSFQIAQHAHSEEFHFAVSDNSPPYSSKVQEASVGIVPSMIELAFKYLPTDQATLHPFPWSRAQHLVEQGKLDGLLTYPSDSRKQYALFTDSSSYSMDYGFLIYHRENPNRGAIENASSFNDLRDLTVIVQSGVGWEEDNIPSQLNKMKLNTLDSMIHVLLHRQQGDFLVMPPEQARYWAKRFGYQNRLAYRHVDFITNAITPFHIGIRKSHPEAERVINDLEQVLRSEDFKKEAYEILDRFRD